MYLKIALNIALPKTFFYSFEDLLDTIELKNSSLETLREKLLGLRVFVNFNHKNSIGIITDVTPSLPDGLDKSKIKPINAFIEKKPLLTPDLLKLLNWMSDFYMNPIGMVYNLALPPILRKETSIKIDPNAMWQSLNEISESQQKKLSKVAKFALELLSKRAIYTSEFKELGITSSTLKSLENKGFIKQITDDVLLKDWSKIDKLTNQELTLNPEQDFALKTINNINGFKPIIINGVTGSGKTEVYLQAISQKLKENKQVLVLIPEINLTPQTISRFYQRFNVPIVCIHSNIKDNDRLNAYLKIKNNEAAILIGTRSALFTPFNNLGLIILDEEHDSSYRQTQNITYHARDCAIMRAYFLNIPIVMGSATPSLETLNNVNNHKFTQVSLNYRAGNAQMVKTEIVDLKKENSKSILSYHLIKEIHETIYRGEQVLLFINRRAFSSMQICHDCGYVYKCQHCDTNLFYHKTKRALVCHECEHVYPLPTRCPQCGSTNIIPTGEGTEKIEEEIKQLFPTTNVVRIDSDATKERGALETFIEDINNNKYQILIGTQMLAKGHHFPNVTLVGILNLDSYLYSNDFRATEHLAQLITQVSGRAGRANLPGKVILQTHLPNHPLLKCLVEKDYNFFAQRCLEERKRAQLPPFAYQALIKANSLKPELVNQFLLKIVQHIAKIKQEFPYFTFFGPYPEHIEKKLNKTYMQIYVAALTRKDLQKVLKSTYNYISEHEKPNSQITFMIEVDPLDIM
ncbi:MAG: primosomal protein N' [Succinivibrionaceae bacterium]|nr:primosomal protein N' [Ruminobacter sp.]MDY5779321.1 primosomal protein N' [Succinivibrionaceae bacterium]MEE1339572.1 primosomal protein N' [Succinivibrionaceae bacterium]